METSIKELQKRALHEQNPHDLIDIQTRLSAWFTHLCEIEQSAFAKHLMYEQERKEAVARHVDNSSNVSKAKETAFIECSKAYKDDYEARVEYNAAKLDRMALDNFIEVMRQKVSHAKKEGYGSNV